MIALIPARGGSKGLPGKNLMKLGGVPLIVHSINAAKKSESISEVFVSTDSEEIKQVAEKAGAKVPFLRPKELATDSAVAIDTYLHFINFYKENIDVNLENLVVLLPTSPLRSAVHIEGAIKLFREKNPDSVISFTKEFHPISWHKELDEDFKIKSDFFSNLKNRQDESVTYFPNGSIYIFKVGLLKLRSYYSQNSYAYLMEKRFSVDIDDADDFEYAQFLISKYGF